MLSPHAHLLIYKWSIRPIYNFIDKIRCRRYQQTILHLANLHRLIIYLIQYTQYINVRIHNLCRLILPKSFTLHITQLHNPLHTLMQLSNNTLQRPIFLIFLLTPYRQIITLSPFYKCSTQLILLAFQILIIKT